MSLADKRPESVLIIGAGMAGLTCAKILSEHSVSNQLFEKSLHPGGRMSTRMNPQWHCDHGAQYFTACDPRFISETTRWQRAGVVDLWQPRLRIFEGEPVVQKIPSATIKRYVGVPSMRALGDHLATDLIVHFGSTIDRLRRSQLGWQVHSKEHGWSEVLADAIVLAMPSPQSLALLQTTASVLSAKMATFTMSPTWAVMLQLDESFDPGFDAAFVNTGALRWIAKDSSKLGRPKNNTWLLHASARWSEKNIDCPANEVGDILQAEFTALTRGLPVARNIHLWRYAQAVSSSDGMCFWDDDLAIGVCGDWLAEGKIEGAWKSGLQMANTIIENVKIKHLDVRFSELELKSQAYKDALNLRQCVLRTPLGRVLNNDDLEGEAQQRHFVYVDKRGDVVATVSVKKIGDKACKIRQMAVHELFRARGLGAMLLHKTEEAMRIQGFNHVTLHARETAKIFYEKNGYKVCGEPFEEVGIAHVKMEKNII